MSAGDAFGLIVAIADLRVPHLRPLPWGAPLDDRPTGSHRSPYTSSLLTALAYPLGTYMARVYEGKFGFVNGRLGAGERAFLRLVGSDPDREQDWKQYAAAVLIFSGVFVVLLYLLVRPQGHLPLNPDGLPGCRADGPEHRGQLRHQHQLAVLRRRVHDDLSRPRWPGWPCRTSSPPPSAWPCWPR